MIVGASNEGGTTRDMPALANNVLGTKFRIVTGYAGTREIALAVERKEIHGLCGYGYTSLLSVTPRWLTDKVVRILVQENAKGAPALNKQGVPRTVDFAKTPEDRQVMELVYSQAVIGRPYVLPEGVPRRARRGAAQGVHGGARGPGAARRSREDEARRRADLRRRCADHGGAIVRDAGADRRARQAGADLQATGTMRRLP